MRRAGQIAAVSGRVLPLVLTLTAGACSASIPDISSFNAPRLDVLAPANPNQYMAREMNLPPVTAADLVDGSGYCAGAAAPQASEQNPQPPAQPGVIPTRGVGLRMTECQVVGALGRPAEVQIAADPQGERTVTMIYPAADRPIYKFTNGRLVSVERGAQPPPEKPQRRQAKRPAS
jgi:hypothetical protein